MARPGADAGRGLHRGAARSPLRLRRRDVSRAAEVSLFSARKFWHALGFPVVDTDDELFTDADQQALGVVASLVRDGMLDETTALSLTRAFARSADRLAGWQSQLIAEAVDNDLHAALAVRRRGRGRDPVGPEHPDGAETARRMAELTDRLEPLLVYAWRRHLSATVARMLADADPEAYGSTKMRSVGFADLVNFTALVRKMSERDLGRLVSRFEALSADVITAHGGRLIKTVGDEVLFSTVGPAPAAAIALDLVDAMTDDDVLPEVRVGMARGPIISRLGDIFGTTVNRASRLRPGSRRPVGARRRDPGPRARDPLRLRAHRPAAPDPARRRSGLPVPAAAGAPPRRAAAPDPRRPRAPEHLPSPTRTDRTDTRLPTEETPPMSSTPAAPTASDGPHGTDGTDGARPLVRVVRFEEPAARPRRRDRPRPARGDECRLDADGARDRGGGRRGRRGPRASAASCSPRATSGPSASAPTSRSATRSSDAELMEQRPTARAAYNGVLDLPVPAVAAVDGFALGGGFELALSCDVVVAGDGALVGLPEVGVGVIPGGGGTQLLVRRVGWSRAASMIFSAAKLPAAEAFALGAVDELVPAGSARARAMDLAATIAANSPVALRNAKRAMRLGADVDLAVGSRDRGRVLAGHRLLR